MARIVFAWESGSGFGHLNRMLQIARVLQKRGHFVCMAVRDLSRIQHVIQQDDRILWFQAPVWLHSIGRVMPSATYAELLFACGFLEPAGLLGLVRGWHSLFATLQPDLLIADHAPVSLLSAHGLPFSKVTIGTGFYYPPPINPCPVFRSWEMVDELRVLQAERRALASANHVLAVLGRPLLQHVHELFATDACFLTVWSELDHYHPRLGQRHVYTGPLTEQMAGVTPEWSGCSNRRVFAYLNASYPALAQTLQALSNTDVDVLVYVAGLTQEQAERYASPTLKFSLKPVQFDVALQEAAAVVCHGGMGTVSSALQAGVPVLALPMHAEQRMTGERIRAMGCGTYLMDEEVSEKLAGRLQQLLHDPQISTRLAEFSRSHSAEGNSLIIDRIVNRCETCSVDAV